MTQITSKGATLIAVTPEKQENITKTIEKTKAEYPILHDEGLKIMKSYDVAYTVEGDMLKNYQKYGIDFTVANGDNGAHLPIPAVYVINQQGKIVYRFFEPDYRKRPSVAEISSHL
jgi:peroxiredoxin